MKKLSLLTTVLVAGLLIGCDNQVTQNEETKETAKTENSSVKKTEDATATDSKEKDNGARFEVSVQDKKGLKYQVSLVPIKEEKNVQKENMVGVAKGDVIYNGDYKLVLSFDGKVKDEAILKSIVINESIPILHVVEGERELILITQNESTNNNWGYVFVIDNQKLKLVKNEGDNSDSFMYAETSFKEVQPYHFETAFYDNMEGKWTFTIYKFNEKKLSLLPSNTAVYDFEEGVEYYQTYFKTEQQ